MTTKQYLTNIFDTAWKWTSVGYSGFTFAHLFLHPNVISKFGFQRTIEQPRTKKLVKGSSDYSIGIKL